MPAPVIGLAYLAAYVLLDRVSYIEPYAAFGITPWNPATGLSFVLVLLFGQKFIPLLFVAPLLADAGVRQLPLPWHVELATVFVIGGIYAIALLLLARPRLRFDPGLQSMRDLLLLLLAAVISAAVVGVSYVMIVHLAGLLPLGDIWPAVLRYWVGDLIGIAVLAPFALIIFTRSRLGVRGWEILVQCATVALLVAVVFSLPGSQPLRFFYLLFLPIVWMAARNGLEGVSIGIVVTQLAVILGVQAHPGDRLDVTALQLLLLVLTLTGFIAGALVTERRRAELQLRQHQDSLARLARVGSMGELAAAIAHEINQPLMAAGTYARIVKESLDTGSDDPRAIAEAARKASTQIERAAEVVRRLRALIRLDRTGRAPAAVAQLVGETLEICRPDLLRHQVKVSQSLPTDLPPVLVDLLQVEQVLLNLVRNGIEAIRSQAIGGTIHIRAVCLNDEYVALEVQDSGPGFPSHLLTGEILPFLSTKTDGLGVGLSLSRSIVESHGGRLDLLGNATGAIVRFTLPIAERSADV